MMRRSFSGVAIALAAIVLAACGSPAPESAGGTVPTTPSSTTVADTPNESPSEPPTDPPTEPPSEPEPAPGWQVVRVGDHPADGNVALVDHDGEMWVLRSSADGTALVVSTIDGDRSTEIDLGGYAIGVHLASTPFGLVLTASGDDFVPHAWISSDGRNWSESVIVDRPVDVTGLTWTGSELLASGAARPETNPGTGPFQPVLLATSDGETWREIDLGVDTPDSWLAPVVVSGDRLVTSVRVTSGDYQVPATLESTDGGATWTPLAGEDLAPERIGVAAGRLFGTNGSARVYDGASYPLLVRTGDRWEPVDLAAVIGPYQFAFARVIADGPRGLVAVDFDRPIEYCFDDPSRCERVPLTIVVDDQGNAGMLDLSALDGSTLASATISANGDLSLLIANEAGLHVATWSAAAGDLPLAPPIELPEPSGPPVIEWGADVEVGAVYRYALYTHCGIDVLGSFGGRNWWIDGEPTSAYDPSDEGLGSLLGEIHVVAEDRLEYVLDGAVIAVYAPQNREIPGCD